MVDENNAADVVLGVKVEQRHFADVAAADVVAVDVVTVDVITANAGALLWSCG